MLKSLLVISSLVGSIASASPAARALYEVKSIKGTAEFMCLNDSSVYNLSSHVGEQLNVFVDYKTGIQVASKDLSPSAYALYEVGTKTYSPSQAGGRGVRTQGRFQGADRFQISEVNNDGFTQDVTISFAGNQMTVATEYSNTSKNYHQSATCILEKIK